MKRNKKKLNQKFPLLVAIFFITIVLIIAITDSGNKAEINMLKKEINNLKSGGFSGFKGFGGSSYDDRPKCRQFEISIDCR